MQPRWGQCSGMLAPYVWIQRISGPRRVCAVPVNPYVCAYHTCTPMECEYTTAPSILLCWGLILKICRNRIGRRWHTSSILEHIYSSFFFSSFPFFDFFDFDLDIACFILSFSCGYYAVSSVSVSAATRLGYDINIRTLVRTLRSRLFIFVLRHTICFSYCVSSVFVFLLK